MRNNSAVQERLLDEWIATQDGRVKRCPRCRVPIEKTEGCNHVECRSVMPYLVFLHLGLMSCRCGVHVCWRCLGTFAAREIYNHMSSVHGGYYGEAQADDMPNHPVERDIVAGPPRVVHRGFQMQRGVYYGPEALMYDANEDLCGGEEQHIAEVPDNEVISLPSDPCVLQSLTTP